MYSAGYQSCIAAMPRRCLGGRMSRAMPKTSADSWLGWYPTWQWVGRCVYTDKISIHCCVSSAAYGVGPPVMTCLGPYRQMRSSVQQTKPGVYMHTQCHRQLHDWACSGSTGCGQVKVAGAALVMYVWRSCPANARYSGAALLPDRL